MNFSFQFFAQNLVDFENFESKLWDNGFVIKENLANFTSYSSGQNFLKPMYELSSIFKMIVLNHDNLCITCYWSKKILLIPIILSTVLLIFNRSTEMIYIFLLLYLLFLTIVLPIARMRIKKLMR
jgi:hypothetical protein